MSRSSIFMLAMLILSFSTLSCSNENAGAAETATTTQAAVPLPEDVRDISAAINAATDTAKTAAAATTAGYSATGEFVSPIRSELSPKIGGRVARVYVEEGSRVRRGQPLLELETDYARLNLRAAEAEVARTKAARDQAARDLERKKELIAKGSIPRATFDRSQATFDQTNAGLAAAAAQVALLRQHLADSTLRSPVDGIVAEKRTDVGARLGDSGSAFVVVQLSPLKLRFQVPERYLGRIEPGDTVVARVDPYPNDTFTGTIKTVGGIIDPRTRTMFAEAEFANRDGRLRPGLFAKVETEID